MDSDYKNADYLQEEIEKKNELIRQLQDRIHQLESKIQDQQDLIGTYETISTFMPGAFFQFRSDKDGQFVMDFLSKGAEKLFNIPLEDQLDPKKMFSFLHPDDIEPFLASIKKSKENMTVWDHVYRVQSNENDSFLWIHGKSLPQKKKDGSVVWNGLILDITNQKNAEDILKEGKNIFQNLFSNLNSGVVVYDVIENGKDFILRYLNATAERIEKQRRMKLVGKSIFEVSPDAESLGIIETFRKVIETKQPQQYPIEIYENNVLKEYYDNYIFMLPSGKLVNVFDDHTERIRFENELKSAKQEAEESDTRLKLATDSAKLGIWEWNIKEDILFWNKRMFELYDIQEDSFSGKLNDWVARLHPEDLQITKNAVELAISGKKEYDVSFRVVQTNGAILYVKADAVVLRDENNQPVRMIGVNRDVTNKVTHENELIKAREEALASELRYKKAQEVGHIGSWEYDFKNDTFWGSDEGKRIYNLDLNKEGFSAEEVMSCICYKDRDRVNQAMIDLVEKNKPYDLIFNIIPKNTNERKIIRSIAEVEKDEHDNPLKVTGVLHDITLQKKTEEALIRAKEQAEQNDYRLKLAIDSGKLGIWDRNLKDDSLIWNERMFELYGIDNKNFSCNIQSWANAIHADDRQRVVNESNAAIHQNKVYNTSFRVVHPDGNVLHLKADGVIIRDEDGKAIRMIGINRDITNIVSHQNELIEAKEKAEAADRLKSAFLANMSHEIRTPMNGILGFTSILAEPGVTGDDAKKYIKIIQKSGERMLNTVNDIIEISKIETGQVNFNYSTINVTKHLRTLKEFFSLELDNKGLEFSLENELTDEESRIRTDKSKLSSIITNLIKNAIKFTDKGKIQVGCRKIEGFLEIYVKDSGIGIPENRIKAIFNRFEQADIGDSRAFEGSGLGLSIARSYVEMLGGVMWVKSEEGKGSTFYFTIPKVQTTTDSKKSVGLNADSHNKMGIKKPKILIAEDDEVSQFHLDIILKNVAREIIFVENGHEAVEAVKDNQDIDLVVMDIRMPVMDGLEATRKIREFNTEIVIIAHTAFALAGDRKKTLDAGCNNYISKPASKNQLVALIEKYV